MKREGQAGKQGRRRQLNAKSDEQTSSILLEPLPHMFDAGIAVLYLPDFLTGSMLAGWQALEAVQFWQCMPGSTPFQP